MPIEIVHRYSAQEIIDNPTRTYVFGDNMIRAGTGGQAGACRFMPNVIGIPTMWEPGKPFDDNVLTNELVMARINAAFFEIEQLLNRGYTVVLPKDGVGTGIAMLPHYAPDLYEVISTVWAEMIKKRGG